MAYLRLLGGLERRVVLYSARDLLAEFLRVLNVQWSVPDEMMRAAQEALEGCSAWPMRPARERERRLLGLVNAKLRLNRDGFQALLDAAAVRRVFLNYHDKANVLEWMDHQDIASFKAWIHDAGHDPSLIGFFRPSSREETLLGLHEQLRSGHVVRKDAKKLSVAERKTEVLQALFGGYVFNAFRAQAMHEYFNEDCRREYTADFYQHLLRFYPRAFHRNCALLYLRVDEQLRGTMSHEELRDGLYSFIREAYERLSNHCSFAIQIEPFIEGNESGQWRLASDLILYAEKHREVRLGTGYFHPREIESETAKHIPGLDVRKAHFELANEGFYFKDCFVLSPESITINGATQTYTAPADLLLLFEKNERDETVIPCPGCRSTKVRGNSYPTLGVRSWECDNPICPEKSAFDRGNRYSLSALIKQEAIKRDEDQIPEDSLKKWKLDVVGGIRADDVADMLLRHFTLHGDKAVFVNTDGTSGTLHGRTIIHESFDTSKSVDHEYSAFQRSAFFHRFAVEKDAQPVFAPASPVPQTSSDAAVYEGDCFEVLATMPEASVDGAVTSPPYYNARSYSEWPNMYCYLYDMFNSARQVYRVLRPGALYLFNIFDYFDNENTIVFSAMGKKRMILGAYIINSFRRVGFQLKGNVVWHKGEIEGKRNFNQGNRSPYYQYPFNCWEHVLIFQKPGPSKLTLDFPTILLSKPVIKIVRGENILGHSAPFPPSIPALLLDRLNAGECVLDPYAGSMTTARAARARGIRSISIDLHREYCELGIRLLNEEHCGQDLPLFSNV